MQYMMAITRLVLLLSISASVCGCDVSFKNQAVSRAPVPSQRPTVYGQSNETMTWNGKQVSSTIRNVDVSSRSRRMADDRLEMTFDENVIVLTSDQVEVNGTKKRLSDYSSVDVLIDPDGLQVSIDGLPFKLQARNFDLEFVHVAPDGAETSMALSSPDVAELRMSVASNPPMLCKLVHTSSSTVDQYRFAYTTGGTTREKLVVFAGVPHTITKTKADDYQGEFVLRPLTNPAAK